MQIDALYVWPVKGLAGLQVGSWPVDARGLALDRAWMVVDAAGRFLSQRTHPQMATIGTAITREHLELQCGDRRVAVPLERARRPAPTRVHVWDDTCEAWDEGDEAAVLVSAVLATPARLVRMTDGWQRQVDPEFAPVGTTTGFSDGFPLLVTTTASLADLNARLDQPAEMERFRPNVVIGGSAPWAEDGWRRLRVGDVVLDLVKPCARCQVPSVNPRTGAVGKEPVLTLAQVRRIDGKVLFGVNAMASVGVLKVGMEVEIVA